MTPDEATAAMKQTCEGVKSCRPILELAPGRTASTCRSPMRSSRPSHEGLAPREMARMLMTRDAKSE